MTQFPISHNGTIIGYLTFEVEKTFAGYPELDLIWYQAFDNDGILVIDSYDRAYVIRKLRESVA